MKNNQELQYDENGALIIEFEYFPYERLKQMRKEKGYTQTQIAERLNITKQQYSLYETGKRRMPIEDYIILAWIWNTSLDYLVGLINEPRKLYEI